MSDCSTSMNTMSTLWSYSSRMVLDYMQRFSVNRTSRQGFASAFINQGRCRKHAACHVYSRFMARYRLVLNSCILLNGQVNARESILMLGHSLRKIWLTWIPTGLAPPEDYVHSYCRSCILVLSSLIASVEDVLTRIFEWESRILSVSPCGVYMARESAIVIVGGGDGECSAHMHMAKSALIRYGGILRSRPHHSTTVLRIWPHRLRTISRCYIWAV